MYGHFDQFNASMLTKKVEDEPINPGTYLNQCPHIQL